MNAVILAHNYQTPEIFHCISDIRGDSLQLAKEAGNVNADIILQCSVHFMAETSKLLNMDKTVLIPSMEAGCSLTESITVKDVRKIKKKIQISLLLLMLIHQLKLKLSQIFAAHHQMHLI